ncbi:hypothetical protein BN10_1490007 [Phycicoccus elongatus Lp2]|uniref:DUF5666 domain-containing protein n=1 Tax=Phycicoccus elongatus Lp2 TaxID=1193181 RepID=N0E0V4_9MICO|nr:hypothetical protein [Phycicoccus elongatus]CCH69320.1 hypothetical protein BN10_1490007 [Phycicoccus elongatus Lp2]
MSEHRPTTPGDPKPQVDPNPQGAPNPQGSPDPTEALPPVDATTEIPSADAAPAWTAIDESEHELRTAHVPTTDEGAGIPPVPPSAPAAAGPSVAGFGASGPGGGSRIASAWRSVWGNGWGKAAIIGVAALATLAIVAAIGLSAFAFGHHGDRDGRNGGRNQSMQRGGWGDDEQGQDGQGQSGRQKGQGQRGTNQMPNQMGPNQMPNQPGALPDGSTLPGAGRSGALAGLGNVLHGEVVVGGTNTRTVLYQVGEVTEFTAGQSLAVKSADGFTATYAVTADTAGATGALTVGATVRVIADKDGAKATRVQVLQAGATN